MQKLKVIVIDGQSSAPEFYLWAMSDAPDIELSGICTNAAEAVALVSKSQPDVVVLDAELTGRPTPSEILERIKVQLPDTGVLAAVSNSSATAKVLIASGAFEYFVRRVAASDGKNLSDEDREHQRNMLLLKIRAFNSRRLSRKARGASTESGTSASSTLAAHGVTSKSRFDIVAVGVSTGGPEALMTFVAGLPEWFALPVVITMHMPKDFTASMALSLSKVSRHPVTEAVHGESVNSGHIYLAPGGKHCGVTIGHDNRLYFALNDDPPENACRPSVEVLFRTVEACCHGRVIVVMLTGMGADGAKGYELLKNAGAWTIAQDEASSIVWGMPGTVVTAGLVREVLPLSRIAPRIAVLSMEEE